jgi:hypothetical protein
MRLNAIIGGGEGSADWLHDRELAYLLPAMERLGVATAAEVGTRLWPTGCVVRLPTAAASSWALGDRCVVARVIIGGVSRNGIADWPGFLACTYPFGIRIIGRADASACAWPLVARLRPSGGELGRCK